MNYVEQCKEQSKDIQKNKELRFNATPNPTFYILNMSIMLYEP